MKYILILILLVFVSCNKQQTQTIENITTNEQTETTQLTEKECWVLFDSFWVEFQKSVVEGDTVKLKEMCELSDEDWNCFLIILTDTITKKLIKNSNKENRYCFSFYDKKIDYDYSTKTDYLDNKFKFYVYYYKSNWVDGYVGNLVYIDGKYKFATFNETGK